jgi:hypothetical protein
MELPEHGGSSEPMREGDRCPRTAVRGLTLQSVGAAADLELHAVGVAEEQ